MAADLSAVIDEVSENTNKSNGTDVAKMEKYYSYTVMLGMEYYH